MRGENLLPLSKTKQKQIKIIHIKEDKWGSHVKPVLSQNAVTSTTQINTVKDIMGKLEDTDKSRLQHVGKAIQTSILRLMQIQLRL